MRDPLEYFRFIREKLQDSNKAEALSWLQEDGHRTIWEHGNQGSVALVQHLYDLGALEAIAVGIEGDACCELIIRLPDDQHARDQVLAWSGDEAESRGFERDEDFGQEHLFVFFT